jgi:hypothetical protein
VFHAVEASTLSCIVTRSGLAGGPNRLPLVPIEHFVWTTHAVLRLDERHLSQSDIENAIREGHGGRHINDGQADWLIEGITAYGVRFEAIYDHPVGDDETTARIVSAWRVESP